jgi:TrmH family RNA methyltransferase
MERIASRRNPLVARCRELAHRRPAADAGALLDGAHLLASALESGVVVDAALFSARALGTAEGRRLASRCRENGVRVAEVSDGALASASPVRTPSGIVAIVEVAEADWTALTRPSPGLVVVTVGVQDPGNLGAIVRSADAGGATGVAVLGPGADPWNWKALRGAMGSTFRLPVRHGGPVDDAVRRLRGEGLRVIGTSPRAGRSVYDLELMGPTAVLVGGEGGGLDDTALALADLTAHVPMRAGVESLNVAVATALIVYEATRQRHRHVDAVS